MSDEKPLSVVDGKFIMRGGGMTMSATCIHRRRNQNGSCGGCHARLYTLMHEVEAEPERAAELVKEYTTVMRAEVAASKKANR